MISGSHGNICISIRRSMLQLLCHAHRSILEVAWIRRSSFLHPWIHWSIDAFIHSFIPSFLSFFLSLFIYLFLSFPFLSFHFMSFLFLSFHCCQFIGAPYFICYSISITFNSFEPEPSEMGRTMPNKPAPAPPRTPC